MLNLLADNLKRINQNIAIAAEKSGRSPSDITLIGVTKTIDISRINHLLDLGILNLGENKVQEMLEKYDVLGKKPNWHMIGHLQTNKVKYIIDKVSLIHSVDSLKLAQEIDKRAKMHNIVMDILMEVNIAGELSKSGVELSNAFEFAKQLMNFESLRLRGVMTIAPFVEKQEKNRYCFQNMTQLFIDIRHKLDNNNSMKFLSMGMTNDYEVAIEEGANMVRIGTGIFGERTYK